MPIPRLPLIAALLLVAACGTSAPEPTAVVDAAPAAKAPDAAALAARAKGLFQPLPEYVVRKGEARPSDAMIDLGRMLYYDPRLSVTDKISCNSCHDLARFGNDNEPTSPGHAGERGGRNSQTSLNAALHVAQFWDGRAADVEEQAKGPVLNPVEMGMPDAASVEKKVRGIKGYGALFKAAFPDAKQPITFDNMAVAIGAFERGLTTPDTFDAFLKGDHDALSADQLRGLETFLDAGCTACHSGATLGGQGYFKLGLVKPYETKDEGRFEVTGNEADKHVFKVPSLRNVTKTGPWLHDGSVASLEEVVTLMGVHQLGRDLTGDQVKDIIAFFGALEAPPDPEYVKAPALPGM